MIETIIVEKVFDVYLDRSVRSMHNMVEAGFITMQQCGVMLIGAG